MIGQERFSKALICLLIFIGPHYKLKADFWLINVFFFAQPAKSYAEIFFFCTVLMLFQTNILYQELFHNCLGFAWWPEVPQPAWLVAESPAADQIRVPSSGH